MKKTDQAAQFLGQPVKAVLLLLVFKYQWLLCPSEQGQGNRKK